MSYRGALIGCGFFAQNHLRAWAEVEGAAIVAVCDIDKVKADTTARAHGIEHSYSSPAEMLEREQLDFVDIATTSASHRNLVELAAPLAKLVICQKPFADTYEDGRAMVLAAEAAGSTLMVHENFRWQLPYRELGRRIAAGDIGTPRFARISFRHGFDNYVNQPYLAEIERFAIMDMGLHLFDLARHLVGEVASVACRTQRRNPRVRGEDAFTALVGHTDGASTIVDCSYDSVIDPEPFPQTTAWIEGDDGTLSLDAEYRLKRHRRNGGEVVMIEPEVPVWGARPWHSIQESVRAFERHVVEVLEGKAHPQPSGAHNLRTLAIALAAYDSAAEAKAVDIDRWIATRS